MNTQASRTSWRQEFVLSMTAALPRESLVERVRWRADRNDYVGVGTIEVWSWRVDGKLLVLAFHWVHGRDDKFLQAERAWIMNAVRIEGGR